MADWYILQFFMQGMSKVLQICETVRSVAHSVTKIIEWRLGWHCNHLLIQKHAILFRIVSILL